MSYESTMSSLNPVLYWRLDESSVASDGDTITDISGNDLHGTLDYGGSSPLQVYGNTSPIETDDASRSFYINNLPFTSKGIVARASDSLLEIAANITVMMWVKPRALGLSLFAKEKTFDGICYQLEIDTNGRFRFAIRDSAETSWSAIAPVEFQEEMLDQWWFVVGVRLGDALVIYVDTVVRGSTTVTSSLDTLTESGQLRLSAGISGDYDYFADEVAIFDYALSGSQIASIYEAALNALTMRGQCDIRTSATLSSSDDPDPVAYSFRHNWEKPVIERFRARTGVFKPTNGSTQLRRQRSALRRQVEYQHLLYNEKLRRQFDARSFGGRTALVQFEPDKVQVASLAQGAMSAAFDTRLRDFEAGHRVLIYQDDDNYEFQTLTNVTDDAVEWSEGLSQAYTRPWIKPARIARLPVEQSVEMQTDVVGDSSTIYEYLAEDEVFNPRRATPFVETLSYRGREAFDLREWQGHDYSELPVIEYVAERSELDDGTGVVSAKQYQWGANVTQPYNMNLQGRELIAKLLGWINYRSGQYQPFWMPTFKQDLKPLARSGNVLLVEGHEFSQLYANSSSRSDLAFVYRDGTVAMRHIESFSVDGANDALSLDSTVPTLTNLRWLSFLRRVILSSDDIEIAWETDEVVKVAFAVVDAPLDLALGSPSVSPSPSGPTSTSLRPSQSSSRSLSPSSSLSPSASISPTASPSLSPSHSASSSTSPSGSISPSSSPSV